MTAPDEPRGIAKKPVEVGWFEARTPITVGREPESGTMWLAEAPHYNQGALGSTPMEAVDNLIGALNRRGIAGRGFADPKKLAKLR